MKRQGEGGIEAIQCEKAGYNNKDRVIDSRVDIKDQGECDTRGPKELVTDFRVDLSERLPNIHKEGEAHKGYVGTYMPFKKDVAAKKKAEE